MFLQIEMFHKSNYCLGLGPLLLLLAVVGGASGLTCETDVNCPVGVDFCPILCQPEDHSCIANFRINSLGQRNDLFYGCGGAICHNTTCVFEEIIEDNFHCCCNSDLCNTYTAPTISSTPSGTIPVRPPEYQICEKYNCSADSGECFHGYVVCADHPDAPLDHNDHFCQALYSLNAVTRLFELLRLDCRFPPLGSSCSSGSCLVDTTTTDSVTQCCCDGTACNANVTFSDPSKVADSTLPNMCQNLGCEHSCFIGVDDVPHCICDNGYILDGVSCTDIDECARNLHACTGGATCANTEGAYECQCDVASGMRLTADNRSCEFGGPVCESVTCAGDMCTALTVEYCLDGLSEEQKTTSSIFYCQTTLTVIRDTNEVKPALSSCFLNSDGSCSDTDECVFREVNTTPERFLFHCCCLGNLCNANLVFEPENGTQPSSSSSIIASSAAATSAALPSPSFISPPTTGLANPAIILITVVSIFVPLIGIGVFGLICFRCFVIRSQRALGGRVPYEDGLPTSGAATGDMDVVLQNRIGQGRFAVVYRGLNNGMSVAVKVFEPAGKESFGRESDIYHVGMLGHPNVLQFIGENRSANGFRLITAYHERGSLYDVLRNQTISLGEFCIMASSAAAGLAHLHEEVSKGEKRKPAIAHRDLKSKNILVKADGQCAIGDFGLALRFDRGEAPMEAHGQVGTSRYMAPEILEGAVNFHSEAFKMIDTYALALILWEMASRTTLPNAQVIEYHPPFDSYVSANPTISEMKDIVVGKQLRPDIPLGFQRNQELDGIVDAIKDGWDHHGEARLTATCIYERIKSFQTSFPDTLAAKDSDSGFEAVPHNDESRDSEVAGRHPSPAMCNEAAAPLVPRPYPFPLFSQSPDTTETTV